ncbi:MAG: cyclic nucleotide-binding domain-containing protein, partial [Leptospiraceae bacterium]|nr:cyclic nucleotide-binding domain-containing protein [Leptospiraceae bacterium]
IPAKELFTLFDFVPVVIGKSYYINGAEFRFNYALHSIPSLSFEFTFEDQSFIYSSDHLNDPEIFKDLYQKGILTDTRYIDLLDFPWHHKIIYHEAGPPPLHTRIDYLNTLPEHIQERVHVYHIPKKNFPDETKLTLCRFGIENTLYPEVTPPKMEGVFRLLDALNNVDIFREFPISKAKDFIQIVEEEHYPRGTRIIEKNTPGDKFFIIMSGNVKVAGMEEEGAPEENSYSKRYGSYEYFGEASLINDTPRSADVFAETDVVALTIDKPHFLNFIRDTNLPARFKRLNEVRKTGTWDVLSNSRFFQATTSAQKTQLELLMIPQDYKSGDVLIEAGRTFDQGFIVKNGTVEVLSKTGELVEELSRGDFSAELYQLQKQAPAGLTFRARTDLEVYAIDRDDLVLYIANNPGVYMSLNHVFGNQ